jgi:hypothetical protein
MRSTCTCMRRRCHELSERLSPRDSALVRIDVHNRSRFASGSPTRSPDLSAGMLDKVGEDATSPEENGQ